ncbi:MAG: amidohydrolase family protein [Candidatus Solibacter usitatus]|nr:amidohydrolase family protein [Candidatus Solibacter usitatus]
MPPLLAVFACALFAQTPTVQVLRFAKVWTATNAPVMENAAIVLEGNRIARVEKDSGKYATGSTVIDLRRYAAIPGMIDAHTHITYFWDGAAGTNPRRQPRRHPAVAVILAAENAKRTLQTGVTTVRDLNASAGNDYALRDLIEMGKIVGPRIVAAGAGIGARPAPPGVEGMRKMVEERLAAGSDVIKLFASTGGFEDVTGKQTLSYEEMRAAVDAAHAAGKRIAIHTYGPAGFRDAVKAGPDSIEHGADVDDSTLREMARKRIWFVPTIDHNRFYIDAAAEFQFAAGSAEGLTSYIARNLDTARRAHAAGVKFAMGSDAVYSMFGQNTRELEWLVKAGLTNEEALLAATSHGAELLGMQDRIGKLAPGFLADIVAVEGEPWKDVRAAINGIRWVMKDGKAVSGTASR